MSMGAIAVAIDTIGESCSFVSGKPNAAYAAIVVLSSSEYGEEHLLGATNCKIVFCSGSMEG